MMTRSKVVQNNKQKTMGPKDEDEKRKKQKIRKRNQRRSRRKKQEIKWSTKRGGDETRA
jgi:hypothetical protein